jgi:hypothetical protein
MDDRDEAFKRNVPQAMTSVTFVTSNRDKAGRLMKIFVEQ